MTSTLDRRSIDRRGFYSDIRQSLFRGRLSQSQVDGLGNLLTVWKRDHAHRDIRWLAYCLATAFHETAHTMQPIEEYGRGRNRRYGQPDPGTGKSYYGRGHVQLTWAANYKRAGAQLGVDMYRKPEFALRGDISAQVLFSGCIDGWFTGHKLADFIAGRRCDYRGARRIVNGTDRASLIAAQAKAFETALKASPVREADELTKPLPGGPTGKPAHKSTTNWGAAVSLIAGAATAIAAAVRDVGDALGIPGIIVIAILSIAAAAYVMRERWIKSYKEGI